MRKDVAKVAIVIMVMGVFGNQQIASAKQVIKIQTNETHCISVPKSWKHVSWKCSNKKLKITKKQGRSLTMKALKAGKSQITAISGKKKKVFEVKITAGKKETDSTTNNDSTDGNSTAGASVNGDAMSGGNAVINSTKDIAISFNSATVADNNLSASLHIKNATSHRFWDGCEVLSVGYSESELCRDCE